jgi:general secretion pathway protein A
MEYYKLLNLNQEPFSNSPDPGLFFRSTRHARCLQELEIAIRLRRGLCVVSGEVGTGKTTICRHLIRTMRDDDSLKIHMILDPSFESGPEMLGFLNAMFNGREEAQKCASPVAHKEMIKDYLFRQGVDEHKTIILVIDEGQKISAAGVEILRELLNYETNDQKLLQIIIFAQNEIDEILDRHHNFADRVGLFHRLLPLSRKDTGLFINFRLDRTGSRDPDKPTVRFTRRSVRLIHKLTGGYPRKIINLCHNILLTLIISGSFKVTPAVVRKASSHLPALKKVVRVRRLTWAMGAAASVLVALWLFMPGIRDPELLVERFALFDGGRDEVEPEPSRVMEEIVPPQRDFVLHASAEITPGEEAEPGAEEPGADTETAGGAAPEPPAAAAHTPNTPAAEPQAGQPLQAPQATQALPGIATASLAAAPDVPQQASAAGPPAIPKVPPPIMGSVRVNSRDSLWRMAERVYGGCDTELLNKVAGANESITNVNVIRRGQRIQFPAVNVRPPLDREKYWVEIAGYDLLDEAYQAAFAENQAALRVLGVWDRTEGFRYLVVLRGPFTEKVAAERALEKLPAHLAARARVSSLDENAAVSGF